MPASVANDTASQEFGVTAAIVLTLTGTGLAAARDLYGEASAVVGIDADPWRPGRHSRQVQHIRGLSGLTLDENLLAPLERWSQTQDTPPVLIPACDAACEWVINHKETLERFTRVSPGYVDDEAGMLLDKHRFGERCVELGIDVPLTVVPRDRADVAAFIAAAGLPCIVKPREGHLWRHRLRGQKLLIPNTEREVYELLDDVIGDPTAVVLQELVPGDESQLVVGAVLTDERGDTRHVLTARKVRQFPRDFGSGSLVRTEHLPDVRALSEAVVGQLGYRGICGTEFKLDPRNGRLRLIEINPRPTLWFDLCRAAGTHLIRAHWHELATGRMLPIRPQRDGVTWRYWARDLIALAQAHGRTPLRFLLELQRSPHADTLATMALRDPRTIAATLAHTAYQAVSHLRR